jgi:hypothetical protein
LRSQLGAFRIQSPFASAQIIAQHFDPTPPTIKDILHKELGMKTFSRRWVPHFLNNAQKASKRGCESSKTWKKTILTEL